MIHIAGRVGRNVLRTFRRWGGFLHGGANAGVLGHQALFEGLVRSCRHICSGTGWKEREAEQAGSDLDFHWLDFVTGKRRSFIITIIRLREASIFLVVS